MKRIASLLAILAVAATFAACNSAAAAPASSIDPNAIHITAHNIAFEETKVDVPANQPFQIVFDNEDSAPHNITVLDAKGSPIYTGAIISGVAKEAYDIPALKPGTYRFRCDVHADMTGTLVAK